MDLTSRRFDLAAGVTLALDGSRARRLDGATGPLVVPARISRTGNQRYASGVEHRPASEVFHPDSLASFEGAPVTLGHPRDMVTMATRDLAVGYARGIHRDANYVAGELVLHDDGAIGDVLSSTLVELSAGYFVEMAPGGWYDGENVAGVQRKIRGNHVALGPKGWGRAGAEVRVR